MNELLCGGASTTALGSHCLMSVSRSLPRYLGKGLYLHTSTIKLNSFLGWGDLEGLRNITAPDIPKTLETLDFWTSTRTRQRGLQIPIPEILQCI